MVITVSNSSYVNAPQEHAQEAPKPDERAYVDIESRFSKAARYAKSFFSYIVFPVAIYNLIHGLVGYLTVPGSMHDKDMIERWREDAISENTRHEIKRINLNVDGYDIDVTMVGKPENLENGKWITAALGNGDFYENHLLGASDTSILAEKLNFNVIYYNYPGIGKSTGRPNCNAMINTQKAIFDYLQNECKATKILAHGTSIGGGVQGEALGDYTFNDGVEVVSLKYHTFHSFSHTVSDLLGRVLSILCRALGWEFNTAKSSQNTKIPEIILQSSKQPLLAPITDKDDVTDDEVIGQKPSLAYHLLATSKTENKTILSIPGRHLAPTTAETQVGIAKIISQQFTQEPEQAIEVIYDAGYGNQLEIRGDGPGLSWTEGKVLQNVADNIWTFNLPTSETPYEYKIVKRLANRTVEWEELPQNRLFEQTGIKNTIIPAL